MLKDKYQFRETEHTLGLIENSLQKAITANLRGFISSEHTLLVYMLIELNGKVRKLLEKKFTPIPGILIIRKKSKIKLTLTKKEALVIHACGKKNMFDFVNNSFLFEIYTEIDRTL
jgi:hypothetical protein